MSDSSSPNTTPRSSSAGSSLGWEPPPPEKLQEMLPQYEITVLIGRGGMGAVYRGIQLTLDRPVAIKILPPGLDDTDATYSERFRNEALAMAKLNHPGIVAVYDFGSTSNGMLYIVMEFVDGTDVAQMMAKQKRLPSAHAMAITTHVCDALKYAHERGIVHRDIKPANIMVGYDGVVKVADFGLAKMSQGGESSGLTHSGLAMGTMHYIAPEALTLGVMVDQRADIYAMGVMLYHMLTGGLPQGMFELPSLQVPGLDPRYDGIISRALRNDRELRYQTVVELRYDLDAILTQPVVKVGANADKAPAALNTMARPQRPAGQPQRGGEPPMPERKMVNLGFWVPVAGVVAALVAAYVYLVPLKQKTQRSEGGTQKVEEVTPPPAPASASTMATSRPTQPVPQPPATAVKAATGTSLPAGYRRSGMFRLFNGRNLDGWSGLKEIWSVQDGAITMNATQENVPKAFTSLIWNHEVKDFEFTCKFRFLSADSKAWRVSGIQFRSRMHNAATFSLAGYNAELDYDWRYTGGLGEKLGRDLATRRGERVILKDSGNVRKPAGEVVDTFGTPDDIGRRIKRDEWSENKIVAAGPRIQIFVNGLPTIDVIDETNDAPKSGMLGLGNFFSSVMTLQFKDLELYELWQLGADGAPIEEPATPAKLKIRLFVGRSADALNHVFAPLKEDVDPTLRPSLVSMRDDLIAEGRAQPPASLDAYRAAHALCVGLISALDERAAARSEPAWTARAQALRPVLDDWQARSSRLLSTVP